MEINLEETQQKKKLGELLIANEQIILIKNSNITNQYDQ